MVLVMGALRRRGFESVAFGSSFSVQTHLIDGQEDQGFLLKRRDFLCRAIEPHLVA